MSELSFEQMLEESFKTIHNGEVVEGTVIDVKPDEIILNIGYKADGIITIPTGPESWFTPTCPVRSIFRHSRVYSTQDFAVYAPYWMLLKKPGFSTSAE